MYRNIYENIIPGKHKLHKTIIISLIDFMHVHKVKDWNIQW
jgi:hypothetical protein